MITQRKHVHISNNIQSNSANSPLSVEDDTDTSTYQSLHPTNHINYLAYLLMISQDLKKLL